MSQGKLVFLVLMKSKLRLERCLMVQSMELGVPLMMQLKKWPHHQEGSISCLQRCLYCYIFEFERDTQSSPTPECILIWSQRQIIKHFLSPIFQVISILKGLWKKEARFCMLLCDFQQNTLSDSQKRKGYEMFFLNSLLVSPNRFRPSTTSSLGVSIALLPCWFMRWSKLTAIRCLWYRWWNIHKMFCYLKFKKPILRCNRTVLDHMRMLLKDGWIYKEV